MKNLNIIFKCIGQYQFFADLCFSFKFDNLNVLFLIKKVLERTVIFEHIYIPTYFFLVSDTSF